jgi:hypothetical protein
MEFVRYLVNEDSFRRNRKSQTKGCRNEIHLTAVNVLVGVDKFRENDG